MKKSLLTTLVLVLIAAFAMACTTVTPKHTVSFDTDGGTRVESQKVLDGETAQIPTAPTKDGYEFVAWYLGNAEFDFATPITENLTLTAIWEENTEETPIESESDSVIESEPESDSVIESESDSVIESEPESDSVIESEPESDSVIESESESDSVIESESESDSVIESESESESASESESESDSVIESTPDVVIPLDYSAVVGAWTGVESAYGYEMAIYDVAIFADGTGEVICNMQGYEIPLADVKFEGVEDTLVMTYDNNGTPKSIVFTLENGSLVCAQATNGGQLTLTAKNVDRAEVIGTWVGTSDYQGVKMDYTVEITQDSVIGKAEMYGYAYDFTFVALSNRLVLSCYGVEFSLVYANEKFVGLGFMQDPVTLKIKVDTPAVDVTYEELVGTWVGFEMVEYSGVSYTAVYAIIFMENGMAIGQYSTDGETFSDLGIQEVVVSGSTVTLNCVSGNYVDAYAFTFKDGKLTTESGALRGKLTLTKQEETPDFDLTFADIAGTWSGVEESAYGTADYTMVITENGTVTLSYLYYGYETDAGIISATFEDGVLTLTDSYETTYVFTLTDDGALSSQKGVMGGAVTLLQADEPAVEITFADIAGTWSGVEESAYGTADYTMVITENGTVTLNYLSFGYETDAGIISATFEDGVLTLTDSYETTYVFTLTDDGSLSSQAGVMGGAVTLTKNAD